MQGILFSLEFKISGNLSQFNPQNLILSLHFLDWTSFYSVITNKQNNNLYLSDKYFDQITQFVLLEFDKWYILTCSFQIAFDNIIKIVYLNGQILSQQQFKYSFVGQFFYQIFNDNQYSLCVKNTQIYQGGFYEECGSCKMSTDLDVSNCLFCGGNLFLQEERSYQCVSQCSNNYSTEAYFHSCDYQSDLNKQCNWPFNQYFSHDCICPDGTYEYNNYCIACPQYCITCSSATKCIEYYGIPRSEDGKCNIEEFDDGKSCISDFIIIPSTQNSQLTFKVQNIDCNTLPSIIDKNVFSFQDSALFIGTQSESFFLTLSFKLNIDSPFNQNNYYTIFYLTNNEYHIFTLAAKAVSENQMKFFFIQEYLGAQEVIISGHLEAQQDIQIGFYTDLINVNVIVKYLNSPLSLYQSKFKKLYPILTNPSLVFAVASPLFSQNYPMSYFCGQLGSNAFLFKVCKISYLQYPSDLEIVKFEIILNYQKEELEFMFPLSQIIGSSSFLIQLGYKENNFNSSLFISEIQIYQGGYYYVNYDNNNPCFVTINKSNFKCIIPKKDFAIKNDQAIPSSNCNLGEDPYSPILFYNPYTMKCQNSHKIMPYCLLMDYSNINLCSKCFDEKYMDKTKNCECVEGMYLDEATKMCKFCSKVCKSCSQNRNYCLQCTEQSLFPPDYCDQQCDSCFESSNKCISCSQGRINPPYCYCDPDHFTNSLFDPISKECEPIYCQNKCLTCSQKPDKCIRCKGDRVNPPICDCPQNYFEDPNIQNQELCSKCESNFYYDKVLQKCIQCNSFCKTCFGPKQDNCLSCFPTLQLNLQGLCTCREGNSPVIDKNNNFQCYKNMDIIQNIYIKNNQYFILIQFEYEIDFFNQVIQNAGIDKVFSFSIGQVGSIYYQVVSYSISASDQITLSIELKKDFLRTFGQLIFLKSDIFQNFKHQAVLNPVYLKKPFQFQIGPYFMQKNFQIDINLSSALNQYVVDFIRNFQVLFYLVNSAQPTVMLLLVDVSIPPNFYKFLSQIGNLVFKNVSEYSQTQFQNTYTFAEQNIESYTNSTEIYQFDRVGFRVYTIYLRPHDYLYRDILKGIADIILSSIWIFMIYFNYLFKSIQGEVNLSDEKFFKKKIINFIIKMKESKESEQKSVKIDEQFQDNDDFKINKKIVYEQN
ncbi:hypothetical protein ABPG72_013146 [Tetrahymena utriculariae]